jgi:hypothetical protein
MKKVLLRNDTLSSPKKLSERLARMKKINIVLKYTLVFFPWFKKKKCLSVSKKYETKPTNTRI